MDRIQFLLLLIARKYTIFFKCFVSYLLIVSSLHNVDSIVYGTTFRFNPEEGFFKSVPIRRIHRHPTYEGGVQPNDIAIIELMEPILPDRFAQAIDLDDKEVECNSPVASYGFGRTQRVQVEHRMQVMETKVRNNCERTMRFDQYVVTQIDDKTVCNVNVNDFFFHLFISTVNFCVLI